MFIQKKTFFFFKCHIVPPNAHSCWKIVINNACVLGRNVFDTFYNYCSQHYPLAKRSGLATQVVCLLLIWMAPINARSTTKTMSVISLLLKMVKRPKTSVKFSRQNIYARDRYKCQYCGNQYPTEELTYDHVMPKSRGGTTEWENIVTCCIDCNRKKGGRIPSEASMQLVRRPKRPTWIPAVRITIGFREIPQDWRDYLYWNGSLLDQD